VVIRTTGSPRTVLVKLGRALLRIPHLAIHLDREIRETGVKLNPQQHAVPLLGLAGAPELRALIAAELAAKSIADAEPADVLAFDLMLYDVQRASRVGAAGEFLCAPRLDNLASCHAALCALLDASGGRVGSPESDDPGRGGPASDRQGGVRLPRFTRVVVLHDHEEVGSRTEVGAWGPFLLETLGRAVEGFKGGEPQGLARSLAGSRMVSADMAHAVHPNYADRHDPAHAPRIGGGPVLKMNANQSYASDARSAGFFTALCQEQGITPQHFVSRNDMPCGSTIGPISAARIGVPTVDVGNPMLSMHSCREMAGSADVEPMIRVLRSFFDVEDD
jgi:aspartyl aminopeptidase